MKSFTPKMPMLGKKPLKEREAIAIKEAKQSGVALPEAKSDKIKPPRLRKLSDYSY